MKKKMSLFIMSVAAVSLFLFFCFPAVTRAQEVVTPEELLKDPSFNFEEVAYGVFGEENVISTLEETDEEVWDTFLDRLTEEELYKFVTLYKYSLLTKVVNVTLSAGGIELLPSEGMKKEELKDSAAQQEEKIDKDIAMYSRFQNRLRTMEENSKEIQDEQRESDDLQGETEELPVGLEGAQDELPDEPQEELEGTADGLSDEPQEELEGTSDEPQRALEGTSAELSEGLENGEGHLQLTEAWEKESFQIFQDTVLKNIDIPKEDLETIDSFESYKEYLQSISEIDVSEFMGILERIAFASDLKEETTACNEAKEYLYTAYSLKEQMDEANSNVLESADTIKSRSSDVLVMAASPPANAVARVGNTYYATFNQAFDAMPDGGTMYVIRDCSATHIVTTKSFSIYPEGRNVKVTYGETSFQPAGIICTPEGRGNPTWTFGGNNGYTITFDANQRGGSGVISTHAGTINLKSGVRLLNARGNGVWNDSGTTNIYNDAWIYNNGAHGIATLGTINMYGGKVYGNQYDGLRSQKVINLYGGEIFGNLECGVHVGEGVCTLNMTGGDIHDNVYGVANLNGLGTINISAGTIRNNRKDGISTEGRQMIIKGSVVIQNNGQSGVVVNGGNASIQGGKICGNSGGGIVNKAALDISGGEITSNSTAANGGGILNSGTLKISGGIISGNGASGVGGGICVSPGGILDLSGGTISGNTSVYGNGIYYNGSAMNISGNGAVDTGNDVYLETGKFISVTGALRIQTTARVTLADYKNGRKVAMCAYGNKAGSMCYQNFELTPTENYCLRPGDYQVPQSGSQNADVVLSSKYVIHYNGNYSSGVKDIPSDTYKYWYEEVRLSPLIPSVGLIKFSGWSEDSNAEKAVYQPDGIFSAYINKETTLYAVWGTKIKVTYTDNRGKEEKRKSEYVTLKECMANQGYTIQKNSGFTKYQEDRATFAGWDITKAPSVKTVLFPESQTCTLAFEELLDLTAKQQGNTFSKEEPIQEIILYATWDEAPVITAEDALEFYEGTEVSKEMLLENVKAMDKEDGDLTENICILKVEYADGKVIDGIKYKGTVDEWADDMPDDYLLNTWFLQLGKEEAPVIHKITYSVKDSIGNKTDLEWTVIVKYNEFPVLEAEDWYFTVEEAKNGDITEERLLTEALLDGRVNASDKEDDELYPGQIQKNIKLVDFQKEDFVTFEESGFVVITYSVKDSMGPKGEGKETFRQCTVHVLKDGEVVEPEPVQYVRFINQEYYEKNLNAEISSEEENGEGTGTGGLYVNSKWYRKPEYKDKMLEVWREGKAAKEVWNLTSEDVKKVKGYVKEKGIGNSRQDDALAEFIARFEYLKMT